MTEKLKACPFCKSKPKRIVVKKSWNGEIPADIHHPNHKKCYLSGEDFYEDEWQTRPLEDTLQGEIERSHDMIERLIEKGNWVAKNYEMLMWCQNNEPYETPITVVTWKQAVAEWKEQQ